MAVQSSFMVLLFEVTSVMLGARAPRHIGGDPKHGPRYFWCDPYTKYRGCKTVRRIGNVTRPLPIACTLSAPDLEVRAAELRAIGGDGLLDVSEEEGRAILRFRPDPALRTRLEAVVAAEAECCAFLDFRLDHGDDATVLAISAPNGGGEMVHGLAAAFMPYR
jgi:hypothetical protein